MVEKERMRAENVVKEVEEKRGGMRVEREEKGEQEKGKEEPSKH